MKHNRIILSLVAFMLMLNVQAQEWRGFIEMYCGTELGKSNIEFPGNTLEKVSNTLSFGLNYTMGTKVWKQLYAGVGVGGYSSCVGYKTNFNYYFKGNIPFLYFPIFANVRWIPDITKSINPFVDIKIGYQVGTDLEDNSIWGTSYYNYYYIQHANGVYFQPGVGVRFGRDTAFNLGIAYNVFSPSEYVAKNKDFISERIRKNHGSLLLTVGIDF